MNESKSILNLSSWIFDSFKVSAEGLSLYRIFCGLFLLFFLLPVINIYPFISSLPNEFFLPPPGPMVIFEGFPPYWVFISLHWLLIGSIILMILGWRSKMTSIATGLLLLILKGFIYSVGKINHELLLIVTPILMAFSGWGTAYSIDSMTKRKTLQAEAWPLVLLALIIGFMFFTAGFSKLIGGWLDLDSHATLGHFYKQYFVRDRQDLLSGYVFNIHNPVVWEIFDYATVLFEVGFLFAIFWSRLIRIYVCFAVLFHFSIMMILNISFLPNFIAYAAFINWTWVQKKLESLFANNKTGYYKDWLISSTFLFFLALVFSSIKWFDSFITFNSDLMPEEFILLCFAVLIAVLFLGNRLLQLIKVKRLKS